MNEPVTFLVVEPDSAARNWLRIVLSPFGDVVTVADGAEALTVLRAGPHIDLMTIELNLPDQSGRQLLQQVVCDAPGTAVVVITHLASLGAAVHALNIGAAAYLLKPVDVSELVQVVNDVLARWQLVCA